MATATSIIIPAHNKPHRLRLTLMGLVPIVDNQTELIVVCDNATDQVVETVRSADLATRVVFSPGLGRAGARNFGASAAAGELLFFLDDDVLLVVTALDEIRRTQQSQTGLVHARLRELFGLMSIQDPTQGGPGCPPIDPASLRDGRWSPLNARVFSSSLERAAEAAHANALPFRAPWLAGAGAGLSIPRSTWEALGGFDESYGTDWGLEDLDFAIRAHEAGVTISLSPSVLGYHMSHARRNQWEQQNRNFEILKSKYQSPEILALPELLSSRGSLKTYVHRVNQIRTDEREPE